jgi:hypothetical protein
MPCSNYCTTRTERPAAIMPSTTSTAMVKMVSTICQQPLSGDARPVRPGPSAESPARPLPATLSVNTYHGRGKFWCAATDDLQAWAQRTPAGRVRGRTSSPAAGAAASGTAATRGQRSWPGSTRPLIPAGAGSSRRAYPAGHVISVTVMTGPAAAGRSHVRCARPGMNLRPCRRRRRQCDAGAGERQRRQTAPELGVPCRSAAANSPSTGSA